MPDRITKEQRSLLMSKIRGKNTGLELSVFRALRLRKFYFQKHYRLASGTPDIALPKKKIAIFIDGDFWHGYRFPSWKRKLPEFWRKKIERNRERDRSNFGKLRRAGWRVARVWEHELKNHFDRTMEKIVGLMDGR